MKKIISAVLISLIINILLMYVNYRSYLDHQYLKYSFKNHGGEITIERGFGLEAVHVYAMEMGQKDSHRLRFDLLSFLLGLIVIALIIYVLIVIVKKIRNRG